MERGLLAEHPVLKEADQFLLSSGMGCVEVHDKLIRGSMADCKVWRVGEVGLNGKESNLCLHVTRSCTHCSSSRILFGLHSLCFILAPFQLARAL